MNFILHLGIYIYLDATKSFLMIINHEFMFIDTYEFIDTT